MKIGQILCNCNSNIALAADSNGNLTMGSGGYPPDPSTVWILDQGFSPQNVPLGATIKHQLTGNYLSAKDDGTLVLGPLSEFDGWSTWTFGGQYSSHFAAIRPFNNDDLNLNVYGGCGNTKVGLWSWGGGQGNEVWTFRSSSLSPPPTRYRIFSGCTDAKGQLNPLARGPNDTVVCGPSDITDQIWYVDVAIDSNGWLMGGISIVNSRNGKPIYCLGIDKPVGFGAPNYVDQWTAWTIGSAGGPSPYFALRIWANDDQNLNVFGGCQGGTQQVGTWTWGGGDANEIWVFEYGGEGEASGDDAQPDPPTKAETW